MTGSPLVGRVAVVTGASSGIGRAISLALAARGAALCLIGRDKQRLESVALTARGSASNVRIHPIDLTLDDDVVQLVERVAGDFGHVDVLIHSAGVFHMAPHEEALVRELDIQYRTNVRAPYLLTQSLLPLIKPRRGQIVFLNSSLTAGARANVGQYASTQNALKAMADCLREEVNRFGVRVLSVFLGRTATPRMERIFAMEGKSYQPQLLLQPEDVASIVINALELPATAEVTEVSLRPLLKSY